MKIGIFTAMEKEAASFLQAEGQMISVGGCNVYSFKLGSHDAYLCSAHYVGEIAAASACQILISQFHVDVILNFGIVGALDEDVAALSTVYVGDVVHYDMDLSQIDGLPVGRYGCFDDVAVACDAALINKALKVQNAPVVRCASADKFVNAPKQKAALNADFGAKICDMESAAVLFVCKFNKIPCLLVKCVADSLCGGSGEYRTNALKAAEGFFRFANILAEQL